MRVFFAISGLGKGNASRCAAIIEEIYTRKPNASVVIATSGPGLEFLQEYLGQKECWYFCLA